jgi:hypothetical protein
MRLTEIGTFLALAGFHLAITLVGLYRARVAWQRSAREARADRGTMWRLAFLRVMAITVALSGGILAIATPLLLASSWGLSFLPTTVGSMAAIVCASWVVWIPSTIALDNLALRWLKQHPAHSPDSSSASSAKMGAS